MWLFEKVHYRVSDEIKKVLSVFHGPQCTFESAVDILCEATKRVWLENTLYHHKIDLLDAMLDALGTNRPTNQVAEQFAEAMRVKLYLAPNSANAIAKFVRLWKERQLGRVGLIQIGNA